MPTEQPALKVQRLRDTAILPTRGTPGSSGLDVCTPKSFTVAPHGSVSIALGLRFEVPPGYDLSVYNKSGIASKDGLDKGAELIDCDYRGDVIINLHNRTPYPVEKKVGDKIAQLVMREVWIGELVEVDKISTETERAEGGFGSTDEKNS